MRCPRPPCLRRECRPADATAGDPVGKYLKLTLNRMPVSDFYKRSGRLAPKGNYVKRAGARVCRDDRIRILASSIASSREASPSPERVADARR